MNEQTSKHDDEPTQADKHPPDVGFKSGHADSADMTRLLCTGDFQLDKPFRTLGLNAADFRAQLMTTFEVVLRDHALDHDLVLIAGDLFDSSAAPTRLIEAVADVLAACPTPCVVLAGNHDSVNSGIPEVLAAALEQRGASHVHVPIERKPLQFAELGVTVYPAPLLRKDDLSDQWGWIPAREEGDGRRIALMHGALTSLPGGSIPEDLATTKDLDLVVLGDQHGPGGEGEATSTLFNMETSQSRRLYYSMAPEAQHINQNFVGAYTTVVLDGDGIISSANRTEVGELRFVNETTTFDASTEAPLELLDASLAHAEGRPPTVTSIRLTLEGTLLLSRAKAIRTEVERLRAIWPVFEVRDNIEVSADEGEAGEGSDEGSDGVDPVLERLLEGIQSSPVSAEVRARAVELYRLNSARWA